MPMRPRGSHHSAASAENRATSRSSTVEPDGMAGVIASPGGQGASQLRRRGLLSRYIRVFSRRRLSLDRAARPNAAPTPWGVRNSTMSRLVMKFGGTSVADLDRIRNVARHVKREVDAGHQVAVVVSALAGVTNQLVAWCRTAATLHDAREYDAVVASGEQVTAGLLAIALQALGIQARSWAGWQIPIRTSAAHAPARLL